MMSAAAPAILPHIAIVAPDLDILGGQGIQATALAGNLRADGYPVSYVPVNPAFPGRLRLLRRLPIVRTLMNEMLYVPSLRRLRDADVVHVYSASYWSFLLAPVPAMLAARNFGKRIVLNYHSGEAEDHLGRWGALVHPMLKLADEIVVPSPYLEHVFARFGYPATVVRNIVDTHAFAFRDRVPLRPRWLSIRNLERHYRVDVVLRAFALFRSHYPGATLVVAGYGSEERRLQRLVRDLRIGGVEFIGRVEPDRVPELYDDADIFVNASEVDNQPVSILEAFAAGLAVVSTGVGDIGAMLRGGSAGSLVPCNNAQAIAAAAATLIEEPTRTRRLLERAREEVEHYTWPQVSRAWEAVYRGESP